MSTQSYENWSREDLIKRLTRLDSQLAATGTVNASKKAAKPRRDTTGDRPFDFKSYPRRKIALKFCYSGWEYNGLVFQDHPTPLCTVESVLFDALATLRLIDPEEGPKGCDWERCGRTDVGVSAAGQVVSLWVRKEIRYVSFLNNVLPPTIRVLAWSPVSPSFSSRFACKHRHYKYFFHGNGLNVSAMRDAASRLLGEHDFRNLCKLDPSKQITSFKRKILRADISSAPILDSQTSDDTASQTYVFDLIGTAFLYHQVRHIMGVLFLIGSGLEPPSVMTALLNTDKTAPYPPGQDGEPVPDVVDCKPEYQMADGLPLMLWDCAYSEDDVKWRGDDGAFRHPPEPSDSQTDERSTKNGETHLYNQVQSIHSRSLIHSALDAHFLRAASIFHPPPPVHLPLSAPLTNSNAPFTLRVPLGGGMYRHCSSRSYIPLLRRKRLEPVEVVNERWRVGKGGRRAVKRNGDDDDGLE
ncbi:tRNA pseudouridine synthase [Rickenella mellea]|uniref:tRNA pseudouridine synthase n=1 Tax=Rickenella mellea TaxID=50990 RepID=A0A4Y7QI94_9AGAM|nr:tRNA pseudouridine synthase [Rickenella mellea]